MKKPFCLLLALTLLISCLPLNALASETAPTGAYPVDPSEAPIEAALAEPANESIETGICGDNVTWTLDKSTGVLTISGTGPMTDYLGFGYIDGYPAWYPALLHSIKQIIIEPGITSIGANVFAGCSYTSSISIPETVTSIRKFAFMDCSKLTELSLPEDLETIGYAAFSGCSTLAELTIPHGVTKINDYTFSGCGLTAIHLPDNLESIGEYAFKNCRKLKQITIPLSVQNIEAWAFHKSGITSIVIPEGITWIRNNTFDQCDSLIEITLPRSLTVIGGDAFFNCKSLKDVYYNGTEEQWEAIDIWTYGDFVPSNMDLTSATIHCMDTALNMGMLNIKKSYDNFYLFRGDPNIYNMNTPDAAEYAELSTIAKMVGNGSPGDIRWFSSDESILSISLTGSLIPDFIGHAPGTVTVTVTNGNGENLFFPVTVLQPNILSFETVHDAKQFYYGGGFYSEESQFSDCVEIFLRFENMQVAGYPCRIADPADSSVSIAPITLTAQVNGENLSFDRENYQNTYTRTYDAISLQHAMSDLLMLFPLVPKALKPGDIYTVNVKMESESFEEAVTSVHTFTICDATLTTIDGHVKFASTNNSYLVSKGNHYGHNMAGLKKDPEYWWSKWSSFDFENYYEVVISDLMIGVLNVQQKQNFSLMPKLLKEWGGNFQKLAKGIDEVLDADGELELDITESEIDKIFKMSKYDKSFVNNDNLREDAIYRIVMDTFTKPDSQKKLHKVFQKIDNIQQIAKLTSTATDFYKEFLAWGNTITLMNAYHQADEEMKRVVETVLNQVPLNADPKLREAIHSYINYDTDVSGQATEIFDAFLDSAAKMSYDTFDSVWGKKLGSFLGTKLLGFIGNISIKGGAKLAQTTVFQSLGPLSTGASVGLFLSDLICDSSDKASEMGKIIAMADYAPYFIEALDIYEDMMLERKTLDSVALFETAFQLHQSVQSYIMEHTYNLLILKAESLIQIIRGNDEFYDVAGNVLLHKNIVDNMRCCSLSTLDPHTIRNTRHIAIKCPVDVSLYSENGTELVRIRSSILEYASDDITACILDSEKHLIAPADQEYTINISATDVGTMDYLISEYKDDLTMMRTLVIEDIPLKKDQQFTATLPQEINAPAQSYSVISNNTSFVPETPTSPFWGDVNGDGFVDSFDASLIMKYDVMLIGDNDLNLAAADVSGDGWVDSYDASLILKYDVMLITKFPVEE